MQHEIRSPARGYVRRIAVEAGETIYEGHALLFVEEADVEVKGAAAEEKIDLDHIRPDLAEYFERRAHDARRQAARRGGAAAQDQPAHGAAEPRRPGRSRQLRRMGRLRHRQPAHAAHAGRPDREDAGRRADHRHRPGQRLAVRAREEPGAPIAHYDYTVLAGTQGKTNHHKKDRLFEIVEEQRLPLVFFTEGGGGRPGDVDVQSVAGLNTMAFHIFGRLSGVVAAGRHQLRPLLCRQCRDPGLLRRGDRDEELVDRHGRPGDDRGRQSRRVRARGSRPDERAGAQRHGRHRGRGRGRGGRRRQEVPLLLPGRAAGMAGAPTSGCCAAPSRRTGCASTTCAT